MDDLILKFLDEEITTDEIFRLKEWIAQNKQNKDHFRKSFLAWKYASIQGNHEFNPEVSFERLQYKMHKSSNLDEENIVIPPDRQAQKNSILKWAAIFLLLAGSGAILFFTFHPVNSGIAENVITVPRGSKSEIKLPDGSVVWLNAGSILTYDQKFGNEDRNISLSGEGYFSVSRNKRIPFVVHTSDAIIKAVGTEFNVKAYPDEDKIETILVKGSVIVQELRKNKGKGNDAEVKSIVLVPGEKVNIYRENPITHKTDAAQHISKEPRRTSDTEKLESISIVHSNNLHETSWKSSRWTIKDESMANLKLLLERHYNITVTKIDDELMNYRFSGTIENETFEEVMNIITLTIPLSYSINKGNVILKIDKTLLYKYQDAYK